MRLTGNNESENNRFTNVKMGTGGGGNISLSETAIGGVDWVVNIKDALTKRGIENAYQLWLKIGGSKATASQLWEGNSKMIRLETMNRLQDVLGITPFEYLKDNGKEISK